MPIYAYRCAACGHSADMLRKLSDPPLTACPSCGAPKFEKQVTAAGFQLKGSGWYATDFRDGGGKKAAKPTDGSTEAKSDASGDSKTEAAAAPKQDSDGAAKGDAKSAGNSAVGAPAAAPAAPTNAPTTPGAAAPPPRSSSS